jgi:hypothetical protein
MTETDKATSGKLKLMMWKQQQNESHGIIIISVSTGKTGSYVKVKVTLFYFFN